LKENGAMVKRLSILMFFLLIVIAAGGCDRYVDSRDPVRSVPEPLPAPTGLNAQIDSRAALLTWQFANPGAVGKYYIYQSRTPESGFVRRDSTTDTQIRIENLTADQVYFFKVAAVDRSGYEGLRSDTVSVRAAFLAVSIASGAEYTRQTSVQVRLSAPSATTTEVLLSEDPTLAGAATKPYQSQISFSLTAGDGVKTVYARFIFSDGTESEIVSDDIILDTEAKVDSVAWLPDATEFAQGDDVDFFAYTGEAGGEAAITVSDVVITLLDDGQSPDAAAGDGTYSARWTVPDNMIASGVTVTARFVDAAGNSDTRDATRPISITGSPAPVELLSLTSLSSWQVALDWSEALAGGFAAYVLYRDTQQPVTEASEKIVRISSRTFSSYTDTTVDESTTYYYRVFVENTVSQTAGSNTESITTPANAAPDPVVLAASVQAGDVLGVLLSWTSSGADDFESYRVYRSTSASVDTTSQLVRIVTSRGQTTASDAYSATNRWYRVYVYDRQGKATGSNVVEAIN
jgi:hypothetical protein